MWPNTAIAIWVICTKFSALLVGPAGVSAVLELLALDLRFFPRYFRIAARHPELMPYVGVVLASVQLFFLTLNNFVASPFAVLALPGAGGCCIWLPKRTGMG